MPPTHPLHPRTVGLTPDSRTPVRTCIGCRQAKPAAELLRCRLDADERAVCGALAGRLGGRGAWVCAGSVTCFDTAVRRGAFARAWKRRMDVNAFAAVQQVFGTPSAQVRQSRSAGMAGRTAGTKG